MKPGYEELEKKIDELERQIDVLKLEKEKILAQEGQSGKIKKSFLKYFQKYNAVYLLIDPSDGKIVDFNSAASNFYGYTDEQFQNLNIFSLTTMTEEEFRKEIEMAVKCEKNHFEFVVRLANNKTCNVEVESFPVNIDGRVYLVNLIKDVTNELEKEKNLQIMNKVIATSINAFAIADLDANITFVNNTFLKYWGYSTESDVLGKNALLFWETISEAKKIIEALFSVGFWNGEMAAKHKNGQIFYVQLTASIILGEDRNPLCLVASFIDITHRKETEKAIDESEAQFRVMFDKNNAIMYVVDPENLQIIDVNQSALNFYGYSKDEFLKLKSSDLRALSEEEFIKEKQKNINENKNINEFKHCLANGEIREVDINSSFIRLKNRKLIFSIITDRSLYLKAQRELDEAKGFLENLIDCANAPIIVWNNNNIITRTNLAFENLCGKKTNELVGNSIELLFPEASKKDSMEMINRTSEKPNWESVEMQVLHKSGEIKIVLWNSANVYSVDGDELIATIAQGQDITERKQAEEALHREVIFNKALLENMVNGLVACDATGEQLLFNKTAREWQGIEPVNLTLEKWPDQNILLRDDGITPLPVDEIPLIRAFRGETIKEEKMAIASPGQPVRYISANGCPFFDENGKKIGAMMIMQDVTQRKKTEEDLNNYTKELQDANAAKEKFFSIIAHDLKNPFNSILGFSELLRRSIKNGDLVKSEKYTNQILISARNTYNLLENLLEWGRSQSHKIIFMPEKINFNEILNEVIEIIKPIANAKQINLSYFMGNDLILLADRNMIKVVIRNLLMNSIKFTGLKGNVQIYAIENQDNFEITVSDNGIGISKDARKDFFSNENFITSKGTEGETGTGIGLLLCKEFVERHGGHIWVEENVDVGSEIKFIIPKIIIN